MDSTSANTINKLHEINTVFQKFGHNLIWSSNSFVSTYNKNDTAIISKDAVDNAQSMCSYDGEIYSDEAKAIILNAPDENVIDICYNLAEFSMDFIDDMVAWNKYYDTTKENDKYNIKVCRQVLSMCGGGFSKLAVMYYYVLSKPDLYFIHNPMVSLHPTLGREVLRHLKMLSPSTTFVITNSFGFTSTDRDRTY